MLKPQRQNPELERCINHVFTDFTNNTFARPKVSENMVWVNFVINPTVQHLDSFSHLKKISPIAYH